MISVDDDTVTIRRAADLRIFTVSKSVFDAENQAYFEKWLAEQSELKPSIAISKTPSGKPIPKSVLFIGNSYTRQSMRALEDALKDSPYKETRFKAMTKNGETLDSHYKRGEALEEIKTGNWDLVVLQCQSQTPALPGKHEESFFKAVENFTEVIEDAGAQAMLFMTWAYRDGDDHNPDLFPDYSTMQKRLTDAYEKAARKNSTRLAPVGEAWSAVRQKDHELGEALYREDGSHPSDKGAYLATCVLLRSIFEDSLSYISPRGDVSKDEANLIKMITLEETRVGQ